MKLTKIGNATHGRTICKDGKGKVYVVAQDGVILKDTYVKVSAHRKVVKLKNGARVAVDGSRKDGHGRSIVYDANGKQLVMSHDNKILKSSYVARSDRADIIRKNKGEAHKATVEMMDKQLKDAQATFDKQMRDDGWAGDFADWVGGVFGSDNTADKVRADLKTYKNNVARLQNAAKKVMQHSDKHSRAFMA